jgi:hypothetical protein
MIDRETLEALRAQALEKKDSYIQMLHEANGAIGMLEYLLSQVDKTEEQENVDV